MDGGREGGVEEGRKRGADGWEGEREGGARAKAR